MKRFFAKNLEKFCDSHAHLGVWENSAFFTKSDLDIFLRKQDKIIVSNLDCIFQDKLSDEIEGNKALLDYIKNDSRYLALLVCEPNLTCGCTDNIEKLLQDYPNTYVGLKFHPRAMELSVLDDEKKYLDYIKLAQKYNLPCVFHSEGCYFADVDHIFKLAKKFPQVPFVFVHMGAGSKEAHIKAISHFKDSLITKCANIYMDISWVDTYNDRFIKEAPSIKDLLDVAEKYGGENKILFSTDAPLGCFGQRAKSKHAAKKAYLASIQRVLDILEGYKNKKELRDKIFYSNAQELFKF